MASPAKQVKIEIMKQWNGFGLYELEESSKYHKVCQYAIL